MRTAELIASHGNTDFDAFAAMVAARKLYPEAAISLGGAVNRNVREFQALYADLIPVVDPGDVDRGSVRRLILVDTVHANRIGDLADLCARDDVQVLAFDHHILGGELPAFIHADNLVSSSDGSLVTLLVGILVQRGIAITPFEATVFALGIHEDTGSLTFSTTTPRDAEALALCMQRGADTALLEKWLTSTLTPAQRHALAAALESAEELPLEEATVLVSALREEVYVEGVSVVAHRVMDLTGCDACFLLVEMEGRIFVTARSRGGRLDVAAAVTPDIQVPAVTTFLPAVGPPGTAVAITGTGFGGATAVAFNGAAATLFNVIGATQVAATVPVGATSGPVSVTTPGGTAASAVDFTVTTPPAVPRITTIKPSSGRRGATVTISGSDFGATGGASLVRFGATTCTAYVSWSGTQIACKVPVKSALGRLSVTVTTSAGASNAVGFAVRR